MGESGGEAKRRSKKVLPVALLMRSPMKQIETTLSKEIIEDEILTRLPVKSMLKFRCVCKSWLSLISSSRFIKNHLITKSKSNYYAKHKTIVKTVDLSTETFTYYAHSSYSMLYDTSSCVNVITQIEIPTSSEINRFSVYPIGSCNGLVCVSPFPEKYTIFNPSLKKFHKLPAFDIFDILLGCNETHGFGYDEVKDDYKIVRIVGVGDNAAKNYNVAKIYSIRNHCWKKLNNPPIERFSSENGVLVSGKLHWVAYGGTCDGFISLDMVTEEFGKVAHPKHGYGKGETMDWSLLESQGCLFSFSRVHTKKSMDFWEMKEYGVEDSWTKLGSISYSTPLWLMHPYPFFVTENGVVMLLSDNSVDLYNLQSSEFVGGKFHGGIYFQSYIESLVPPYLDGGDDYTTLAVSG